MVNLQVASFSTHLAIDAPSPPLLPYETNTMSDLAIVPRQSLSERSPRARAAKEKGVKEHCAFSIGAGDKRLETS